MAIRNNRTVALLFLFALCGCSFGEPSSPALRADGAVSALVQTGGGKIAHVVYIVQENRSFDDMFQGYPGADTVSSGKNSKGETIKLQPTSLAVEYDIDHSAQAMFAACHGTGKLPGTQCRMDGFNKESAYGGPPNPQYVYVPHSDSKPYFDMAHEGVLADRMFQSQLDESYVAHQYIIAAQAQSSVDLPFGLWGCGGGSGDVIATVTQRRKTDGLAQSVCFDYQTLGDELDRAGLSWRFYTSKYASPSSGDGSYWSSYQSIRHIYYGPDWVEDVITPQTRFLTDIAAGKLASFTWITPICVNSDHPNCGGGYGPSWVAALVNAVGKSKFWKTTAIFVQWDDWGGLYDHVPPPFEDYDGLGFRVPLLILSPYARENRVSHVQYETASVLRFAEDLFGLSPLAAADKRATSPAADCFDFTQPPKAFIPIKAPKVPSFFLHQRNDLRPPDNA
ncbi:MAG TPA: alkaline phosphatase family protein [Candidatus Babeliales bacterium]|nr:alkaline phosphatase family protein [Candidatus Babeliales bacterium]